MSQSKGNKIKWTPVEDKILTALIAENGAEKWALLARQLHFEVQKQTD